MLSEDDLRQILNFKTEGKNQDYKESLNWSKAGTDQKVNLVKDVLAFANTQDGGRIVIGIRDSDYEKVGLSKEDFESFDQTKINDFVEKYTDPKHRCQVYKKEYEGKRYVIIDVPEFSDTPVICKRDANSTKKPRATILKGGQLYIRTDKGDSVPVPDAEEMRALLGRAVVRKRDELLASMNSLFRKPGQPVQRVREQYESENQQAQQFFAECLGSHLKGFGTVEFCCYPTSYQHDRVPDPRQLAHHITSAKVASRGWEYPYTNVNGEDGAASYIEKGRQSYTIYRRDIEAYRAYQSGLFVWHAAMWEDVEGYEKDGRPLLSFIGLIVAVAEFLTFYRRYYGVIASDSDLQVKLLLRGTKGRMLASLTPDRLLRQRFIAQVDSIKVEKNTNVTELGSSLRDVTTDVVREIFLMFNWENAGREHVDQWLDRYFPSSY